MGQVIAIDFAARRAARSDDADAAGAQDRSSEPVRESGPVVPASPAAPAGPAAGRPAEAPGRDGGENLVEMCRRMRAESEALQRAVEDLRRAGEELGRLPAMARELCEAAV